jgi:signal transduction histidine kinase
MEETTKTPSRFVSILRAPEMQLFWVALFLLVVSFTLDFLTPSLLLSVASGALLAVAAFIVFLSAYRSARVNTEMRLEANELRSVLANLNDAAIVYDQSFAVFFFNPAAERTFGVSASLVVGTVVQPKDVERPERRLLTQVIFPSLAPTLVPQSKPGAYPQIVDLSFEDPPLELRVTTVPVIGDDGTRYGFMKIIRDRTREIFLLRSKTEFISVASHQLRTPVNEIKWATEFLAQDAAIVGQSREILTTMLRSVRTVADLIDNLLNTSRIEEGRFGYNFAATDLVEYVGKVLAEAMPQVERAGLKLYFDRPEGQLPQVMIDAQKLSMVLSNLLDNAIRYNVKNGEITVRVAPAAEGSFLEVSVKDTGIGVPAEQMAKLFSKFFRADNAVKFQADGSGLGLYIAKNIIRAHGGQLWADSAIDRGSTFHFTLPTDPSLVPSREAPLDI